MDGNGARPIPPILLLGCGRMGSALLAGWDADGLEPSVVLHPRAEPRPGSPHLFVRNAAAIPAGRRFAAVVAAVKPQVAAEALPAVADRTGGAVVLSIMAGRTLDGLAALLPPGTGLVRAMPNTPAAIGEGVTGLADGAAVTDAARAAARAVFQSVGAVVAVPEARIDALSAVSGSGPAYVFRFVESMLSAARALGFGEEDARAMVLGTVSGAVDLLVASGEEPAELRRRVTSPGGTTERAVAVLDGGLDELLLTGMRAAIARAGEIAAG